MPRSITVQFDDGSSHIYDDVPDETTPEQVQERLRGDFPDLSPSSISRDALISPSGRRPVVEILPDAPEESADRRQNLPAGGVPNNIVTEMRQGINDGTQDAPQLSASDEVEIDRLVHDTSVSPAAINSWLQERGFNKDPRDSADYIQETEAYRAYMATHPDYADHSVTYARGRDYARELLGPQHIATEDVDHATGLGSSLAEGLSNSLNGAILAPIADVFDLGVGGVDKDDIREAYPFMSEEEVEATADSLIGQRIKDMRDHDTSVANAADPNPVTRFLGNAIGGLSLVDAIPLAGAETFLGRAAIGAGANALADGVSQGVDTSYGAREGYDPSQTFMAGVTGVAVQGGFEGLIRSAPHVFRWMSGRDGNVEGAIPTEPAQLSQLDQDLALLSERGLTQSHFSSVDEVTAAAARLREAGPQRPSVTTLETVPDAESVSGSFGPGNVAQPQASDALEVSGVSLPSKTVPRAETTRLGEETGLTRETYGEDGSIGDISPVIARGLALTQEVGTDVLSEFAETGAISHDLRHQLEDVAGTTSENLGETGRALNMARGGEGLSPSVAREFVTLVDEAGKSPRRLAALQRLANLYRDDPAAMAKIVTDSRGRDILDIATSVRLNGMLSSLRTQAYNIAGYTNSVIKKVADPVGITLDKALSPVLDRLFPSNAGKAKLTYRGSVASLLPDPSGTLREAVIAAVSGFRTGQPRDNSALQTISRGGQKAMRWEIPRKMMAAVDEFFDTVLLRQERTARAMAYASKEGLVGDAHTARVQELVNQSRVTNLKEATARAEAVANQEGLKTSRGMTPEQRKAVSEARAKRIVQLLEEDAPYQIKVGSEEHSARMRFQDSNAVGRYLNNITRRTENFHTVPLHRKHKELFKWAVQQLLPFANTTQNLISEGLRSYTILALPMNVGGVFRGGIDRQRALTNMALGSAATLLVAPLLTSGRITGEGPQDPAEREKLKLTGWRPNSYRTDDGTYISYKGLDPIAAPISLMATLHERRNEGGSFDEEAGKAVGSFLEIFAKNSWAQSMTTIADLFENTHQSNNRVTRTLADMTASFVTPAAVRDVADATTGDTRQVDLRGDGSFTRRVLDQVKKTWFQSEDLPQQVNALGSPLNKDEVIGPDGLSRVTASPTISDPVVVELARLGQLPSPVDKGDLRRIDASREQVLAYQELSGQYIYEHLSELVVTQEWASLPAEERVRRIEKVERDMRAYAREDLFPDAYAP